MLITFYSFKGGVGRTQLLANMAIGLANHGLDLVLMDMDLESPGLHTYFHPRASERQTPPRLCDQDLANTPGLIDVLTEHLHGHQEPPDLEKLLLPLDHPNLKPDKGRIRLLPPGRLDTQYPQRVSEFSWERFYQEAHGYAYMEYLRDRLLSGDGRHRGADLVLVDSRTGLTDVGSICTGQLPDILVILFALHAQGIEGTRQIARSVDAYRSQSDQPRLKHVLLLPARVDDSGSIDDRNKILKRATAQLARCGTLLDELGDRIPYEPCMAYGEPVVIGSDDLPTPLSKTYERFVGRLLALTSLENLPARRAEADEPDIAPVQLLEAIGRLSASALDVQQRWDELNSGDLQTLPDQSQRIMIADRAARIALAQVREFGAALSPADPPADEPGRASDWQPLARKLETWGTAIAEQWIENWIADARKTLIEASGSDGPEVAERLLTLREAAHRERRDELATRLAEAEKVLRHDSLDQRLKRRELTEVDLRRIIPDEQKRRGWIGDQLIRLQEATDLNDPRVRGKDQLFNALDLLAATLAERPDERPDPGHWSAYDLLCALINPADTEAVTEAVTDEERACFGRIGIRLWCNDWQGLIDAPPGSDLSWPSGLRARTQLRRLAADDPDAISDLVGLVTEALAQARHSPQRRIELFESRDQDPVLQQAVLAAGSNPKIANRREILGCWLAVYRPRGIDPVLAAFLRAVADEGYEAEAFYGAGAALSTGQGRIDDDPRLCAELATRYAALLLRKGKTEALGALLVAPGFVEMLSTHRAGLGLIAFLAGFGTERFALEPELLRLPRTTALHGERRGQLPAGILQWLESQEQQRVCDPRVSDQLSKLAREAEDAMTISVYRNWDASVYFKNAFQEDWREVHDAVLAETGANGRAMPLLDGTAEDWIDRTFKALRAEGKHVSEPDASAKTNLIKAYERIRKILKDMRAARPTGWSICQVLDQSDDPGRARADLQAWLHEGMTEGQPSAEQRVSEIIGEAEA